MLGCSGVYDLPTCASSQSGELGSFISHVMDCELMYLPIFLSQGGVIPHPFLLPQGTRGEQRRDHREHLGEGAAGSVAVKGSILLLAYFSVSKADGCRF